MGAAGQAPSSNAQGIPDWQGIVATENFFLLPAYDDAAVYFALPRVAHLAKRDNGAADFFLEFVSDRNGAKPEESLYATIHMGLTRESSLRDANAALSQIRPRPALMPAMFTLGNYWHLECPGAHATGFFAWEDAQRATVSGRLSPVTGQLLYAALANGSMSVARAAVECEMAAFLPRVDSAVTFNAANLIASLGTLNPGGTSVPFQRMVKFLDDPPSGLFRFDGAHTRSDGQGLALAGRVRHFFGKAAPCPRISDGPHVSLGLPPGGAPDSSGWDLRTPLFTGTPVFLAFDPFTAIVENGQRASVTAFTRVPPLPRDLLTERVTVASGLPRNMVNCDGVDVTLRVDKEYSLSGAVAAQAVTIYPPEAGSATVELEYRKIGPKPYSHRITAAIDGEPSEMPWFEGSGDYLFIGADRLPGICVTTMATSDLLAQASVSVAVAGMTAVLTPDQATASFLLPAGSGNPRVRVTAADLAKTGRPLNLDLPGRSVALDLSSFPEYGPRTVSVAVQFHDGVAAAQFEFLPESGGEEPIRLGFTASNAMGAFSYFPDNLFRNRYRFRAARDDEAGEAGWSDFQNPEMELKLAVYRDGARISNAPGEGRRA